MLQYAHSKYTVKTIIKKQFIKIFKKQNSNTQKSVHIGNFTLISKKVSKGNKK